MVSLPSQLPSPNERRVAVRVTKDAQRQVRSGHPWVFPSSIVSLSHDGDAGDLAVLFDDDRKFVAIGLYDPSSPLRVRVLHHGRPVTIDSSFWASRIDAALARRAALASSDETNAYRCIHGENDGLPGFVLDRYDTTYVIKLDTHAWFAHLADIVPVIVERTGAARVVLRLSRAQHEAGEAIGLYDGDVLAGDAPPSLVKFRENGLIFDADVVRGQKTGHFLDQRDNRARVRDLSSGASVLDVFSCTGGFTVHAAAGGAISAHSVDLSSHALEGVKRNLAYNRDLPAVARCTTRSSAGDAFSVMRGIAASGERFGMVIIDPPSFASKQADIDAAIAAYRKLTALGVRLTERGGVLVQSSCSSRVTSDAFYAAVHEAAADAGRPLDDVERTGHAVDHPVGFAQGSYLKTLFALVP
jgi:23S rRNA (cytosine1962-C5)-methyltransferase